MQITIIRLVNIISVQSFPVQRPVHVERPSPGMILPGREM